MKCKYIGIDCEFGGIHKKSTLLTGALVAFNSNFEQIDKFEFKLLPDEVNDSGEYFYFISAGGMKVNGINLDEFEKEARKADVIQEDIKRFLKKHSQRFKGTDSKGKAIVEYERITVVGHAVRGDLKRLKKAFKDVPWNKYLSKTPIDTLDLSKALRLFGILPSDLDLKLNTIADYLMVDNPNHHEAYNDAIVPVQIVKEYQILLSNGFVNGIINHVPIKE